MVVSIQACGDLANWQPYLHALVCAGVFNRAVGGDRARGRGSIRDAGTAIRAWRGTADTPPGRYRAPGTGVTR